MLGRRDREGYNLLHCTAALGLSKPTWALVRQAGLDANVADGHGNTPLHLACAHGHQMAVEALLAAGAEQQVWPETLSWDLCSHVLPLKRFGFRVLDRATSRTTTG